MNPSYNSGGIIASAPDSAPEPMQLGGNSKKPKKTILVVAAILIVVLIAVLMVVMMMSGKNNGNNNSQNNSQNTPVQESDTEEEEETTEYTGENKDFYQYANYILNGTKESKTIANYNKDKKYAVMTAVEDKNTKYFTNANTLWSTFYKRISADTTIAKDSKLKVDVDSQNVLMDFMLKYMAIKDYTEEEMWESYDKVGLDNTIKIVRAEYEKLANTTYTDGAAWAKNKADLAEVSLRLYDAYQSKNCIKDGDYDHTCIEENLDTLKEPMTKFLEADSNMEGSAVTIDSIATEIAKKCFDIRNDLENSSEE